MKLPNKLANKAIQFPESSYGATKVILILKNNRKINNVILAWGEEIIKINSKSINKIDNLDFKEEDIIDVVAVFKKKKS